MKFKFALVVSVAFLAAGCSSISSPPLKPAIRAAALDARTLNDPRLESFLAASGIPTNGATKPWDLQRLTLAAVYFHPDIEVADARLAVAQAAIRTAAQRPNPVLSLSPLFNASASNPSAWIVGSSINLLLELFGKREARAGEAKALTEAARFDVVTASWQVRGRVRTAMVTLWSAEQHARLVEQRRDLQTKLTGFLERRLAVGEASSLDVGRERASRDTAALAVSDAARDIADARVSLATAVGVPVNALDAIELDFGAVTDPTVPTDIALLRRTSLTTRSDVQASLARYDAARAAVRLQTANRLPNFSIGPSYEYDQGNNKYGLNLQADLPIFNTNGGPIGEAEARRREAAANFSALQSQIIGDIDRAIAAYATASASLVNADALAAQQADRKVRNARVFQAGAIDHVTLLVGEIEYAAGRDAQLQALVAQRTALGQLEDALRIPIFTPALSAAPVHDRSAP